MLYFIIYIPFTNSFAKFPSTEFISFTCSFPFLTFSSSTNVSSLFINSCNFFMSFPTISQSLLSFEAFRFLFAFIIASVSSSIVSVFSICISTAYFETKFEIASFILFPIATFVPDATTTFFSVGIDK